jgi:hypothetical protein
MAPFSPHHTAATLKPSHPTVVIDGIHKMKETEFEKELRAHIHAIQLTVHSAKMHASAMRYAPSSLPASTTDARAPATDFEDDGCSDGCSTTADDCAAGEENVWTAADYEPTNENCYLPQLLDDNVATRQPSLVDQIARLGSLEMYWSPWESELLQDTFWGSGSDLENDAASI